MSKRLRRIVFWLWPPYEAHVAQSAINRRIVGSPRERMTSIQADIRASFPEDAELPEQMESLARLVFESENKRREALEGKALEFASSFSVAVSVISALSVLLGDKWNLPMPVALILGIFYVLAIVHLMMAVYWSVTARRVEGLALPSPDRYVKTVQDRRWTLIDRIAMYISQAKFNEPVLTKKANSLAVAESMFLRGLCLIVVAAMIGGATMFFRRGTAPEAICKVPDVAGLDQAAAEGMLVELGLQPIRSNQYDPNVKAGAVIRQDPIAGSLIKPCDAGITILISLGPAPTPSPTPMPTNTPNPTETPTPIRPRPTS
jgi:hypothetical protein